MSNVLMLSDTIVFHSHDVPCLKNPGENVLQYPRQWKLCYRGKSLFPHPCLPTPLLWISLFLRSSSPSPSLPLPPFLPRVANTDPPPPTTTTIQTALRIGLVILSGLIVIVIPNFSTLMALIGSSCCTLLAFILPGIFHYVLFRE